MPRPPDLYTHSQFTTIDSEHKGETVQCNHCKNWTGNIKTLNRKKDHLLKCPQYLHWRAEGHGQDLAPPNSYNKRDSSHFSDGDPYNSPFGSFPERNPEPSSTPTVTKGKNYDISKAFDKFWDDSAAQKCMRVRCRYCGFVRAKNTTRQVEHLSSCQEFLNSTEGQQAVANGELQPVPPPENTGDIWRGSAPNPNLRGIIQRGTSKHPRTSVGNPFTPTRTAPAPPKPSLASHLLSKFGPSLAEATERSFLYHAGRGTLAAPALDRWLAQEIYISRALIPFVGSLVGKVRIPETPNLLQDPNFRAVDLLVSACSNVKKELEFLERTKVKYNLQVMTEEPTPLVKGFCDLFASASSSQSSLLEGLVLLWATEQCFYASFQYAGTFTSSVPASSSYSLPSYLTPGQSNNPHATTFNGGESNHITALHEAIIQNWTSTNFVHFVAACKSIVDELANAQTSGNGKVEMVACERIFAQVLWLWPQMWPEVDSLGVENEDIVEPNMSPSPEEQRNGETLSGSIQRINEIENQSDAGMAVGSPYGGSGLGVISAHNQGPPEADRSQTLA